MHQEDQNPFLQRPDDTQPPSQAPIQPGNTSGTDPYADEESTPHYVTAHGGTSGLAIASLVCGCLCFCCCCHPIFSLPFSLSAIICGHMARGQIRERNMQGDGMAIAGLICGYIALAAALALAAFFAIAIVTTPTTP